VIEPKVDSLNLLFNHEIIMVVMRVQSRNSETNLEIVIILIPRKLALLRVNGLRGLYR
jgi:hypothetical protein